MYGLNNRDENAEMRLRYLAMRNCLASLLNCGTADIEMLFDSENNIEADEIIRSWVENTGELPNFNTVYYEALVWFADENNLEIGKDVDIYTNCLDTHIYAKEDLSQEIIDKLEYTFNMDIELVDIIS